MNTALLNELAWPLTILLIALLAIQRLHQIGHEWLQIRDKQHDQSPSEPFLDMNVNVNTVKAVAKVVAATVAIGYEKGEGRTNERIIDELIRTLTMRVSRHGARESATRLNILWVHQKDEDDVFEKQAFQALGAHVGFVKSTVEALTALRRTKINSVISNLDRPGDQGQDANLSSEAYAGFGLYKEIQAMPEYKSLPFIIYSRKISNADVRAYGTRLGIHTLTNDPRLLFEYVLDNAPPGPELNRPTDAA